jgi:hypothetical protein
VTAAAAGRRGLAGGGLLPRVAAARAARIEDLDLLGRGPGLDRMPELPAHDERRRLVVETAVRQRRSAAELVDHVVFRLVVLAFSFLIGSDASSRCSRYVAFTSFQESVSPVPGTKPFLSHSFGYGARRKSSTKLPHIMPARDADAMTQRGGGTGWSSVIFW